MLLAAVTLIDTRFWPGRSEVSPLTSTKASTSLARATTVIEVVPGSKLIEPSASTEAPFTVMLESELSEDLATSTVKV